MCDRCAVAAQGENAEPGRVHPVPAQSEVASRPDLLPVRLPAPSHELRWKAPRRRGDWPSSPYFSTVRAFAFERGGRASASR